MFVKRVLLVLAMAMSVSTTATAQHGRVSQVSTISIGMFLPQKPEISDNWGKAWLDLGLDYKIKQTGTVDHSFGIRYARAPGETVNNANGSRDDFSGFAIPVTYTYRTKLSRYGRGYVGGGASVYFLRLKDVHTNAAGVAQKWESNTPSLSLHLVSGVALSDTIYAELNYSHIAADVKVPNSSNTGSENTGFGGTLTLSLMGDF